MALSYDGSSGTGGDDYVFGLEYVIGSATNTLNGGAGNDVILGDIGYFDSIFHGDTYNSVDSAYYVDDPDVWSTDENPLIANSTTIPHETAYVETTAGQPEYFYVTLQAGQTLTLDVDFGYNTPLTSSVNTTATLYNSSGAQVAYDDDDSSVSDGGEGSFAHNATSGADSYDPYFTYTATADDTYYIVINPLDGTFTGTETFLLNLSVTGHATYSGGDTPTGADNLTGGSGNDLLYGAAGDDTIDGGAGDDTIDGGSGTDTIYGDAGDDTIVWAPGGGSDTIDGGSNADETGADDDTLDLTRSTTGWTFNPDGTATDGADTLTIRNVESFLGTAYADTLSSSDGGKGVVEGFDGNDYINAGNSYSVLDGGDGTDTIDVSRFDNTYDVDLVTGDTDFTGSEGEHFYNFENFVGGSGANTVTGTDGANIIATGGGDDTVHAGGGDDRIDAGTGANMIDGEAGTDTASYADASSGVTVSLAIAGAQDTGGAGVDTLVSIENLSGSIYGDTLTGDANANTITGGGGGDHLAGGAGNDNLNGGLGDDGLNGDGGYNRAIYSDAIAGVTVDLNLTTAQYTGQGMDRLLNIQAVLGSDYNDTLTGDRASNILTGGAGNDVLTGGGGNDQLNGGSGTDTADYSGAALGVHVDLSNAAAQNTQVGSDTLTSIENLLGGAYNDVLTGSSVANALSGGAGIDKLDGGLGKDTLTGGAGNDKFYFTTTLGSANIDTITDFTAGQDKMYLDHNVFTGLVAGALASGAFYAGTAAHDADDRIIYNSATGALLFDSDGTGSAHAVQFASVATGLNLSAASFTVV